MDEPADPFRSQMMQLERQRIDIGAKLDRMLESVVEMEVKVERMVDVVDRLVVMLT